MSPASRSALAGDRRRRLLPGRPRAYGRDVTDAGGELLLDREVRSFTRGDGATSIETTAGDVEASRVVVCAGVYADRLAASTVADAEPRIVPFRGDYLVLRPEKRHLVRGLSTRVPDPAFPFLGIHTTVRPDGAVWLGPTPCSRSHARATAGATCRSAICARRCARPASAASCAGIGGWAPPRPSAISPPAASSARPEAPAGARRRRTVPGPSGISAQALAPTAPSSTTSCSTRRPASSTSATPRRRV